MEIILQCICGDHESTKCRHQFTTSMKIDMLSQMLAIEL